MADILIRNLSDQTVEALKQQAEQAGRSMQAEIRILLEEAAQWRAKVLAFKKLSEETRAELAGRTFTDSADLIAEDRLR